MHRLVVIDDEYIVVEGIKAILKREKLNCEVVGFAYDGIRALEVIRETEPDIVITDIRIPGMDGLSLIEEAKEFLPDTAFIVISGYTEFEYARRALALGVKSYIDKPVTIDKVREVIERIEEEQEARFKERDKLGRLEQFRAKMNVHTGQMIQALINDRPEGLLEEAERSFSLMREFYEELTAFKQECFKILCMVTEVYGEKNKDRARKPDLPWSELACKASFEEAEGCVRNGVKKIADLMEIDKVGSNHKTVNQLLGYIEDHYQRDIGLSELAEQVGLNPAYLSILFKEEVGVSYVKYLTGLRISKAKALLDKGYKVVTVSEMVGYSNYRYFCDIFKRCEGKTPNEYKQRL